MAGTESRMRLFPYFGGKNRLAALYPKPTYPLIIEPFCGAANYSGVYCERQIYLNDKNMLPVALLTYLIKATPETILALPLLEPGQLVKNLPLPQVDKNLIGIWCTENGQSLGRCLPHWATITHWANYWGAACRERLAKSVTQIKHWRVQLGAYDCIPNQEATWFVDPPYSLRGGIHYKMGSNQINYKMLAAWCLSRKGQVIVCEAKGANWLPFNHTITQKARSTNQNRYTEVYCHIQDGRIL